MDTIGIAEFRSIGEGVKATDFMVKSSAVEILYAKTICPGKFITIISGDAQEVEESMKELRSMGKNPVGSCILPRVHPGIVEALRFRYEEKNTLGALGLLETTGVTPCIHALDQALKNADVRLNKLVIGMGIGGKAYFIVTGEVSSVEKAIEVAEGCVPSKKILSSILLPAPDDLLLQSLGF